MNFGITLFFTRGVSLRTWDKIGMLEREVSLYRRLVERGLMVDFISYGGPDDLSFRDRINGIELKCNTLNLPVSIYERAIPWLHAKTLRDSAIVKCNQVSGADAAMKAARRFNKPFIARCGYLASDFARQAHGNDSREAQTARDLERRVFTGADRVVVTTEQMRRTVIDDYGVSDKNIRVIPNYVDTEIFRPQGRRVANRICFIGRLVEQKNLFVLLDALSGLDIELVMVGEGHLRPSLEDRAGELKISVTFMGNVNHRDLPEILGKSSIFVLPSLYEGHPKALLEAMSCGLAVIGADTPGIRETIDDGKTGILCKPEASEIRNSIVRLQENSNIRKSLGEASRMFIKEKFSLDIIINKELSLYNELKP